MKCKDCDCCRKGWFQSKPDAYVCIGVKEPFVIDNIHGDCTEYSDKTISNKVKGVMCPHCDASYFQVLYQTTTCVYAPSIYKDGELISKTPNTIRLVCHCLNCGKDFSHTSKE